MADTASQIIRVNEVQWSSMAPGISAKPLWSDPASKRRAQLTRFDPGATLPMHRHVGAELLFVIEGSLADEHGATTAGNVGYRPNGCVHSVSSRNGATVLAIITGGIEPATEIAGAPSSQNFNLSEIAWVEAMPGVRQKPIWHDKESKRRAALVRFDPGAQLPRHKHLGDELIFVIEGSIADEQGATAAGNVGYRPNGCVHSVSSRNGATVFAIVTGGVEPATDIAGAPPSQNFNLCEIAWVDAMPGVRQKPIWHDQETRRRAALVRFEPGAQLPRHQHIGDELIFVIEGSNADESGEVLTGNMNYRPNGCTHTVTTKNGATIFVLVTGGVEMISAR